MRRLAKGGRSTLLLGLATGLAIIYGAVFIADADPEAMWQFLQLTVALILIVVVAAAALVAVKVALGKWKTARDSQSERP